MVQCNRRSVDLFDANCVWLGCVCDDVIGALIAEGLLEEFDDGGRRVRYVEREEVTAPNGVDNGAEDVSNEMTSSPAQQPTSVEAEARRLKAENPSWTVRRIAAVLRLPEKRIRGYFGEEAP